VEAAASSAFVARYLPQKTIEKMIASKRSEWLNCEYVGDRVEYEHVRYFSRL